MRISDWSSDVCSSDLLDGRSIAADGKDDTERSGTDGSSGIIRPDSSAAEESAQKKAAEAEKAEFGRVRAEIRERLPTAVDRRELPEHPLIEEHDEGLSTQSHRIGQTSCMESAWRIRKKLEI